LKLILRLYELNTGQILLDNQDISQVSLNSLRNSITFIPQEPILFHRSLVENIRYGSESASNEMVIEAAKKAYAHEFISELEFGYDSLVGEHGIKLSGGQKQRIAIARAILKNSPILLMDEATSSLDSVTEKCIKQTLSELMSNKTTLIIAHRLSTLLNVDRLLVFDSGKIIEDGSHLELTEKGGLYCKLWNTQVNCYI